MLEVLKNFFRTSKPQQEQHFHRPIRARFDAAQTTRDNAKHWAYADQLSADMEASPEVRRTLRMRSRYIAAIREAVSEAGRKSPALRKQT